MTKLTCAFIAVVVSWYVSSEARAQHTEHEVHAAHQAHAVHDHRPLALGLDLVIGFGAVPVGLAEEGEPSAEPEGASTGTVGVNTQSFILSGGYEVAERIGLGLRLPLTIGSVPTLEAETHGTFAIGNVELEAETEFELSEGAELVFSLGIALPTAMGSEEAEIENGELGSEFDHYMVNRLAAASRGFEDNALFEVDHVGIIPKVMLRVRANHLLVLEPFVKLENLIATNSELERSYIAELVFGTFLGCEVNRHLDLGARVWGSSAFLDEIESVGVVEPQVRGHFVSVDVTVGGIIPWAGELTDPQFGGVRVAAVAHL